MKTYSTREYLENYNRLGFVVEGILPAAGVCFLTGGWGTGKSRIALSLTRAVATGEDWVAQPVEQGPVLYMNLDRMLRENIDDLMHELGLVPPEASLPSWAHQIRWFDGEFDILGLAQDDQGHILQDSEGQPVRNKSNLVREIMDNGYKLVVIDTYHKLVTSAGLDENLQNDADRICIAVRDVARETGAAILLLHHHNKEGTPRGSTAAPSTVDQVLTLRRKYPERPTDFTVVMESLKNRGSYIQLFPIEIGEEILPNPLLAGMEPGEPLGFWKGLIEMNVKELSEGEVRLMEDLKRVEFFLWENGEKDPTEPRIRLAHRSSLKILLNGSNIRLDEVIKRWRKENRVQSGKGKDPLYAVEF